MMIRYRRKNQTMFAKEVSRAYSIAKNNMASKSEPSSPIPPDPKRYIVVSDK